MANTLKFGNGNWATKKGSTLAYNDENNNFKPLPFEFSRAGAATRVNKEGLIETVGSGIPRVDYSNDSNGALLLEPARTNLVANSNDFTSWINSGSYITANYGISPDGSQNASRCLFTGVGQTVSKNIGTNGTLSYSVYVKGVKGETIQISTAAFSDESFTLNGEWQRLSYSDTVTNATININTHNNSTARDLLIFGAQLEEGSYPTSYIPTNGTAITRTAETCDEAGNEQVFNDAEGVLYFEASALINGPGDRRISITDDAINNRVSLIYHPNANSFVLNIKAGGSTIFQSYFNANIDQSQNNKIAVKYKSGDTAVWINGVEKITKTETYNISGLSRLNFDNGGNIVRFYGNVKDLRVYNTALTDAELQALTS